MSGRGGHLKPVPFAHLGRQITMYELSAETGLSLMTLYQRWHRGDRDEKLVRPKNRRVVTRTTPP